MFSEVELVVHPWWLHFAQLLRRDRGRGGSRSRGDGGSVCAGPSAAGGIPQCDGGARGWGSSGGGGARGQSGCAAARMACASLCACVGGRRRWQANPPSSSSSPLPGMAVFGEVALQHRCASRPPGISVPSSAPERPKARSSAAPHRT